MNKRQYSYMLRNELARVNKRIDSKILHGYAYDRDARRHRELLSAMKKVSRQEKIGGWVKTLFGTATRTAMRPGFALF